MSDKCKCVAVFSSLPCSCNHPSMLPEIIEYASRLSGLSFAEIVTKSNHRRAAEVRQAISYVAKKRGFLVKQIAGELGGRDTSTITYSQQQAEKKLLTDPSFGWFVASLIQGPRRETAQLQLFKEVA